MATIASKHKLNTKSIKDKCSALKEVASQSRKSLQSTVYPKTLYLLGYKIRKKIFEATKKGSNSKRQRLRQALLQTWIIQCLNGTWLFKLEI